ncbi:MAG TPA: hypothetical protein VIG84_03585, partial [Brevundimonas sp.]
MNRPNLDRYIAGWRGPVLAALLALIAGLPGLLLLPPLDRDESRFAQATAQMLEGGDYVDIRFQDDPRWKKPIGIYWMQAAAVAATSDVEDRNIQPYRLPSLLGAMLAAWAVAWAGAALFGQRAGFTFRRSGRFHLASYFSNKCFDTARDHSRSGRGCCIRRNASQPSAFRAGRQLPRAD